jgi:hypothetical protein
LLLPEEASPVLERGEIELIEDIREVVVLADDDKSRS